MSAMTHVEQLDFTGVIPDDRIAVSDWRPNTANITGIGDFPYLGQEVTVSESLDGMSSDELLGLLDTEFDGGRMIEEKSMDCDGETSSSKRLVWYTDKGVSGGLWREMRSPQGSGGTQLVAEQVGSEELATALRAGLREFFYVNCKLNTDDYGRPPTMLSSR